MFLDNNIHHLLVKMCKSLLNKRNKKKTHKNCVCKKELHKPIFKPQAWLPGSPDLNSLDYTLLDHSRLPVYKTPVEHKEPELCRSLLNTRM